MSGRETGGAGLGRFVRIFDANETVPLFLRILPKKYHKQFETTPIREPTLHKLVNQIFEGLDVRDELGSFLDLPQRFRFVNIKETKPIYEKLCKDYQNKNKTTSSSAVEPVKQKKISQVVVVKQQKQKQEHKNKQIEKSKKMTLKCLCQHKS